MSDEIPAAAAVAVFHGDMPNDSKHGHTFRYVVPYDHVDTAREAMGGARKPDAPVYVAIIRITEAAAKKFWGVADAP